MIAPLPLSPLHDAFDSQDQLFARPFSILEEATAQHAFPAASVAVTHHGKLVALKAFGSFTFDEHSDDVSPGFPSSSPGSPFLASFARSGERSARVGGSSISTATLFDLASLTKVVATATMAMLLYERGLLDLDAPVSAIVPEFLADPTKDPRRRLITLRMLLAHSSGLPAYEKLFLQNKTRVQLLQAVFTMPLAADPATRAVYSDIGFLLLGVALERLADEPLDRFCQREIFAPLAMTKTTFNPPLEIRPKIPPTADESQHSIEDCGAGTPASKLSPQEQLSAPRSTFRQRIIQGEVQDENAHILGDVAPHAGLFSTAHDLAKFAHALLSTADNQGVTAALGSPPGASPSARILRPETVSLFTRREPSPPGTTRALGWDTPSLQSQSGKYFSPASFGHLGYTGTSLWIDPTSQLSITLLTNRTWPDCSNWAIKQIRPRFHDAVIEALNALSS